ncbi:hypothetical protein CLD22_02875 [Rubrivivax gelatinosus]|nr:hypothetical protein [Rubrivivax gelatinosus]
MNLNLGPLGPLPAQAPALLLGQSADTRQRASNALSSLRTLVSQLEPNDLLLRAALMDDGESWLRRLATDAEALRHELVIERRALDGLRREDATRRNELDLAATELMFEAENERATLTKTIRDVIDAGEKHMRETLRGAGVPSAEIDRIVTEKNAAQRTETEARLKEATRKASALSAFIRDPLRRVERLDDRTRAEVEERHRIRCEQRTGCGHRAVS